MQAINKNSTMTAEEFEQFIAEALFELIEEQIKTETL
jgi:hypothetical protein